MKILKYLMDFSYCLTAGHGVCWKGQSLETLKQIVTQQLLKSMETYLTSADRGWKILVIAVVLQEQSCLFPQTTPRASVCGLCSGWDRVYTNHETRWGWCMGMERQSCARSQGYHVPWVHAQVEWCPWPQPACCSHSPACDPAGSGNDTGIQRTNVDGNAEVQMTVEQKTSRPTLGRKPGVFERPPADYR